MVSPDSGFQEIIAHGLSVVPQGGNAIVLSRSAPPPRLARLRTNRFCRGEDSRAIRLLRKALPYGKAQGWFMTFLWSPSAMAGLCQKALDEGIEEDYVRALIQKRNLVPHAPPDAESWPYPLRIHALGRFTIARDGEELCFSGKVQRRPMEFLKSLVSFGGKQVPETRISDALWPDAEGDAAHKAFATTLHRLRKLMGNERAIRLEDGKVTLDPRYCWVDAWAFEGIIKRIEASSGAQMQSLSEKAFLLYKGAFLPEDGAKTWTVSTRERLIDKFLHLVKQAARSMEEGANWSGAAAYYVRGLEADEACEEFYQGLMRCYGKLGKRSDVLAVHRRCKKTMAALLGVDPSAETEALYRAPIEKPDG